MKNIEQLMAEADPVRTLRQTGNVRILKPLNAAETAPLGLPSVTAKIEPIATKPEIVQTTTVAPPAPAVPVATIVPTSLLATPTPVKPAGISPPVEIRKAVPTPEPVLVPVTSPVVAPTDVTAPDDGSPFILKNSASTASIPKAIPPTAPTLLPIASIIRRKARMADVARIVLPPKREDTQHLNAAPAQKGEPSPTVVPPAFPVAAMTARATQHLPKVAVTEPSAEAAPEKIVTESKATDSSSTAMPGSGDSTTPILESTQPETFPSSPVETEEVTKTEMATGNTSGPEILPQVAHGSEAKIEPSVAPEPLLSTEAQPVGLLLNSSEMPKVDPEAHKPQTMAPLEPRIDPEAHKPARTPEPAHKVECHADSAAPQTNVEAEPAKPEQKSPEPAASVPATTQGASPTPEKREFHLANGERVAGTVISETPEAIYIEHATLGVLTIPRNNIAKRLVEIILINGDRIVGDIMAETADTLYVRHASLGMLTVPRAQRSTRVVEAILKDGDRILGEVLTETDTFTVMRSATLGTITIPHTKLAMLNRKIEQIELKSLPPPAPELKDKA